MKSTHSERTATKLPRGHFYGTRADTREVAGLTLLESRYGPGRKYPRHSHEHASFCLVLRGNFTETHRRLSTLCKPSTLLFYPADEVHAEHFHDRESACFIIELNHEWLSRFRAHSIVGDNPATSQGGKLSTLALGLYHESRVIDEVSPLAIEGLALEMMAELSRSSRRSFNGAWSDQLAQATEIVHAKFRESITLSVVADAVGLHPVYLAQQFRKAHRCSLGTYVRRLRVEFACRELANSDAPIAAIGAEAGFFDQSHFTKIFKRFTRMTPADYRKAAHLD